MSAARTHAQIPMPDHPTTVGGPGNSVNVNYFDSVTEDAKALGSHFNSRDQWVFLLYERSTGRFHVRSNQSGSGIRALLKLYLRSRRHGESQ